jgi:hypothetical protein
MVAARSIKVFEKTADVRLGPFLRPSPIVFASPGFDDGSGVSQASEPVLVQAFVE